MAALGRREIRSRGLDSDFKFWVNRPGAISSRTEFLRSEERMKGEYLGACLDYIRWGGKSAVMYEMPTSICSSIISFPNFEL
tara:strand:+ start:1756 stop:2001 length:246 start_codon:yes stop_codon:yes gene_type:complete